MRDAMGAMDASPVAQQPVPIKDAAYDGSQQKTHEAAQSDTPTPSMTYTTINHLFAAIRNAEGDALRVEGVTRQAFAEILKKRSESQKFRLFFSEHDGFMIITIPNLRHEIAAEQVSKHIDRQVDRMGLSGHIEGTRSTTFGPKGQPSAGPGEPDSSFSALLGGELAPWPSVVIEVADSQSMGDLRTKAARWLTLSHYAVRVVLAVKIRAEQGTITIEKWRGVDEGGRPGATTTRASASTARQPRSVQEIHISRPGVGGRETARLNPNSYVVHSGALRLEFSELFLRDPRPGEYDIIYDEDVLRDLAVRVWRPLV